ncbi:hypothetical protein FOCC_FOCC009074, partial [Frankliniella occidentalis]
MKQCLLCGLRATDQKVKKVSLFKFPKDKKLRDEWFRLFGDLCGRKVKKEPHLCSLHFTLNDIIIRGGRPELKPGAVPKIFPKEAVFSPQEIIALVSKYEDLQVKCRELEEQKAEIERDAEARILKLKADLAAAYEVSERRERKTKTLRQQKKRLEQKILRLIARENKKRDDDSNGIQVEKTLTDEAVYAMLQRMIGSDQGEYDNPHLRAFVLALHFYSPGAYRYVRRKFKNAIPCERSLNRWYSASDGDAGFTESSFDFIHRISREKNRTLPVTLMVDDMAIRKKVVVSGSTITGFPDFGPEFEHLAAMLSKQKNEKESTDGRPRLAKEVCVFMVVCLDLKLKLPVGYFLHDKLCGAQLVELAKECMKKLFAVGALVKAIVSDGNAANKKMAKLFGCNVKPVKRVSNTATRGKGKQKKKDKGMTSLVQSEKFQTFFYHPSDLTTKVYYIMDVCHMLKLVRNALAARKKLKDADGNIVSWHYITKLHNLQVQNGLRLTNRLSEKHIKWYANKQKVSIAAQTLSGSVASSLKFCSMIKEPGFQNVSATAKFLSVFNSLFDILNSYTLSSYGLKLPMSLVNENMWSSAFEECSKYILSLQIREKGGNKFHSVFEDDRSTCFEGFLVAISSVRGLFDDLVRSGQMKFLLTYRLSQDHLETFFCKVRQRHGCDNNPSAMQFKGSYKRLLLGAEVQGSKAANVIQQEVIPLLNAQEMRKAVKTKKMIKKEKEQEHRKRHVESLVTLADHFSNCSVPNLASLDKITSATVCYIAGFVVKRISELSRCSLCKGALESELGMENSGDFLNYIAFKSVNNGLTVPNAEVVNICAMTEMYSQKINKGTKYTALTQAKSTHLNLEVVTGTCNAA